MSSLAHNLAAVLARIQDAERRYGRPPGSVKLVAVSKTQPAARIAELAAAGQRDFGESYPQEALPKIAALQGLALRWHFIGPIQANKTRGLAEHFDWVHSVDRLKIARRLSEQRPAGLPPLDLCLQVNISREAGKQGLAAADLYPVAAAVAALPRLRLRGLMAIPAPSDDFAAQRAPFEAVRRLQSELIARGLPLDALSLGMSADLEAAIAAGATLVRVGTALFGPRA